MVALGFFAVEVLEYGEVEVASYLGEFLRTLRQGRLEWVLVVARQGLAILEQQHLARSFGVLFEDVLAYRLQFMVLFGASPRRFRLAHQVIPSHVKLR